MMIEVIIVIAALAGIVSLLSFGIYWLVKGKILKGVASILIFAAFVSIIIILPNFISMCGRAKDGAVKSNMHTVQLAAEDYAVRNDGNYAGEDNPVDAFFGGTAPTNPVNSNEPGLVSGIPTRPGQVGYVYKDGIYYIYGFGEKELIKNATGGTFILSNKPKSNEDGATQ